MKRICILLALLLVLTGCAPSAPVPPAVSSEASSVVSSVSSQAEASSEVSSAVSSEEEASSETSGTTSEEVSEVSSEASEVSSEVSEVSSEVSSSEPESSSNESEVTSSETPVSSQEHSQFYLPDVDVEAVIGYFNEVCLDSEYVSSGDPSVVQKWGEPICYELYGAYTAADADLIKAFVGVLNEMEGFPGMYQSNGSDFPQLRISFMTGEELAEDMGSVVNYEIVDGAVEFWYDGNNCIYDARIGVRCDIDQQTRNSVILEEIFNGLGPIQDTWQREDSIAYAGYSTPQWPTEEDFLMLRLLYHPEMLCGMNADACEDVIRSLYY